jgi:hypothetical protein
MIHYSFPLAKAQAVHASPLLSLSDLSHNQIEEAYIGTQHIFISRMASCMQNWAALENMNAFQDSKALHFFSNFPCWRQA